MARRLLEGALAAVVLGLFFAAPAWAQEELVQRNKKEIAELREKMERAEKQDLREDAARYQKRIRQLEEENERLTKGGSEGKEKGDAQREVEEWAARVKAKLLSVDEGQREAHLERLIAELKEKGEGGKAEIAARMLNGLRKGDRKDAGNEFDKKLQALREEREKAERDFDFERADRIKAAIRALEEKREAARREGQGAPPDGKGAEARLEGLYREFAKARDAGDREGMARIMREIGAIKRGPPEGGGDEWRSKAHAVLGEAVEKFREWVADLRKEGDEQTAREYEQGIDRLKKFGQAIEDAVDPEARETLGRELAKSLQEIRREAAELKASGQEKKARSVAWAAERLQKLHDLMRPGPGALDGRPGARKAGAVLDEVAGKIRAWLEEAGNQGQEEAAGGLKRMLGDLEKFRSLLQTARGPEAMEEIERSVDAGLEKIEREMAGALERGESDRAQKLRWLAGRLQAFREAFRGPKEGGEAEGREQPVRERAMREMQIRRLTAEAERCEAEGRQDQAADLRAKAEALRAEGQGERQPGKGMRGDERGRGGKGGECPDMGQKVRELMDELHKAESEGNEKRAQTLREKIAEIKRSMGEGREGPEAQGAPREEEVQRLRKELEGLRKEMGDLRQMLKKLLEEQAGEDKEAGKDKKEKKNKDKKKKDKDEDEDEEGEEH